MVKKIIYDTSIYESNEDMKIFYQVKNPAIAIDLILERRFKELSIDPRERKFVNQILSKEFEKDITNLTDYDKKHLHRIRRKIRKGEKIRKYSNLSYAFFGMENNRMTLKIPNKNNGCLQPWLFNCCKCPLLELQPNSEGQCICLYQKRLQFKKGLLNNELE
jgi:hypothetical protein